MKALIPQGPHADTGSIIVVIAVDAPLLPLQARMSPFGGIRRRRVVVSIIIAP
jgi:hypothetical protein